MVIDAVKHGAALQRPYEDKPGPRERTHEPTAGAHVQLVNGDCG